MFIYTKQVDYPACVGMSRAAGKTYSLWNDLKGLENSNGITT